MCVVILTGSWYLPLWNREKISMFFGINLSTQEAIIDERFEVLPPDSISVLKNTD